MDLGCSFMFKGIFTPHFLAMFSAPTTSAFIYLPHLLQWNSPLYILLPLIPHIGHMLNVLLSSISISFMPWFYLNSLHYVSVAPEIVYDLIPLPRAIPLLIFISNTSKVSAYNL